MLKTKHKIILTCIAASLVFISCSNSNDKKAHIHEWSEATYSWNSDYSYCVASRYCLKDSSHVEEESSRSTYEVITPSECEVDGLGRYTAIFNNIAFESQTHDETIEAINHDYQFDSFVWSGYEAQAKYVCAHNANHVVYFDAEISSEITAEPTCLNSGTKVYTASYDGESDTKTEILSPTGHNWDEATYTLNGDSEMTAKRVCQNDNTHVEEETVTGVYKVTTPATEESEGEGVYTFTFNNPDFETQTHSVTIPKVVDGSKPKFSEDGKTITYGIYPQTRISDSDLIFELEEKADYISSEYYEYQGEYYARIYCNPYSEDYTFDDGGSITKYAIYWFKYEPITWNVLSSNDNEYLVVSSLLLDAHRYHYTTNNNYMNSSIRDYLNDEFYSRAFALNNEYVKATTVDNSEASTGSVPNQYACDDTEDKVFLLSRADYTNSDYGFASSAYSSSSTRYCKTTDFARVKGACLSTSSDTKNNGHYWTRSPNAGNKNYASYVRTDGYIGYDNNVNYAYLCVRPAITIKGTLK